MLQQKAAHDPGGNQGEATGGLEQGERHVDPTETQRAGEGSGKEYDTGKMVTPVNFVPVDLFQNGDTCQFCTWTTLHLKFCSQILTLVMCLC